MDNSNITLLVVDDTATNLQVLTSIATGQGYNILLAQSGEEALRTAKEYHPDIVLLDIMMSEMDGFEVCRRLKADKDTRQIPVIFVTARTDVDAVEKGFDVGGDDYISKPFNDRVLLARLKTHIERYQLQREMTREHALMTSVLEDSPIMFCRFNNEKELEYINQALQFWFKNDFSKLLGKNLLKLYPDQQELDFIRHLDNITLKNQSDTKVFSSISRDGQIRYIQWTYRGVFDKNNNVTAYQCFGKDVTEQQLMIKKLNERNILLEHSQVAGKMMSWEMNIESNVISFEGNISDIIRGVENTLELQTLLKYVHPTDLQMFKDKYEEFTMADYPITSFFRVIVDDLTYSLRVHAFNEKDKDGHIIAYRGIVQDISELISFKEQSEHLKQEQTSILEAMGEGIAMFDLNHNIVQANNAAARFVGYQTANEIIGKKCYRIFHDRDEECVPCSARDAIAAGKRVQTEKAYGKDRIWSVSSTPVYNNNGDVINVIEVLSDTTELHQQQRELILNRERLNTAFDAAKIGTFTIQLPQKKWVPDIQLMHLYDIDVTSNDLNLSLWYEHVYPEDLLLLTKAVEHLFKQKTNFGKFEFRHKEKNGTIKWFRCSMQIIERDKKGNPKLIIGVSIDISNEHKMLDTIKQQEETLAQSRKLKAMGQLTGGIAHDFNNMLATILGFAELLTDELEEDEELSYYCRNITDTCGRAATLTNQLLTFSRKQSKQTTAIDLHELIFSSIELLRHTLQKHIIIKHNLKAEEHYIMGEFTQLQNVLLNMGFNAQDAMSKGGTLEFQTENISIYEDDVPLFPVDIKPGNYIALYVIDTGIGMDKEVLSKIFEPFFTTKSAGKGTGLGLSSVYGTINAHNGSIYAESTPGEGSIFNIFFPVSALKPKKIKNIKKQQANKATRNGTILIIDDEESIRMMLTKSLHYLGYKVLEAKSGKEAIDLYMKNQEDIIATILDVIMPEMDGVQVYSELKKIDPDIRVLISSGFANNKQTNALKKMGVNGYLRKPFRKSELIDAIEAVLKDI